MVWTHVPDETDPTDVITPAICTKKVYAKPCILHLRSGYPRQLVLRSISVCARDTLSTRPYAASHSIACSGIFLSLLVEDTSTGDFHMTHACLDAIRGVEMLKWILALIVAMPAAVSR